MKARRLIASSTFEPETLEVSHKAFDGAWSKISDHFAGEDAATESARMRLAHAVLIVAREDSRDADRPQDEASRAMALRNRKRCRKRLAEATRGPSATTVDLRFGSTLPAQLLRAHPSHTASERTRR